MAGKIDQESRMTIKVLKDRGSTEDAVRSHRR
jgi:hypothetical protein